jgi:hypothetical protein
LRTSSTFDGNGPGSGPEFLGVLRGIAFVGAEFVEIIVVGDVLDGVHFFGGTERAFEGDVQFCACLDGGRWKCKMGEDFAAGDGGAREAHGP